MKRLLAAAVLFVGLTFGTGCYTYHAPVMPPAGLLFTSVSAPIDTRMDQKPIHRNYGESSSLAILGLFAFGNASVTKAAEEGRLSVIDNVEYSYLNILFIYQQFTIRAYGPRVGSVQ